MVINADHKGMNILKIATNKTFNTELMKSYGLIVDYKVNGVYKHKSSVFYAAAETDPETVLDDIHEFIAEENYNLGLVAIIEDFDDADLLEYEVSHGIQKIDRNKIKVIFVDMNY